ncbi:MAG: dihydrodipicolinate synthase family protein [Beutenbergiaceae bacterium]
MTQFSGLIPPIITPLTPDGSVDHASLRSLIEFQLAAGVSGIFVLGSSGEAIYLDDGARVEVAGIAADALAGRAALLVGTLDSTPARVIAQSRLFKGVYVDGFVVTAPFYANPSPAEVTRHFHAIAAATQTPILAYDIPGNTGRRLDHTIVTELLTDGTIVGFKDSSGSLTEFRLILDALGENRTTAMLTGADTLADLAMILGADGLIPGLANVRPELFVSLLNAIRDGYSQQAVTYQSAITEFVSIFGAGQRYGLGRHASELGALKYLLHRRGVIEHTTVSAPMTPYPVDALRDVDTIDSRVEGILSRGHAPTT